MPQKAETNRYIQLTESGLKRLHETRRRYRLTLDDIVGDENTPSRNTIKRALKPGPVFVDTLERIWDYLRACAEERQEPLRDLVPGEDYDFVESVIRTDSKPVESGAETASAESRWGRLSQSVPRPNRLFMGRRDVLGRLHKALKAGPAALVPDPQALVGLGGIGKTQAATAYVYAYRNEYNGVYWVHAETIETLNDGLAGLAEELELLPSAPGTKKEALQKMHAWFQNVSGWLLVLDNADDIEKLAPFFPRHHTGSLLLTSRTRNTVKWADPIEVFKFGRAEGALLLLRRAGILTVSQTLDHAPSATVEAAMELSDELDGLPLAIDQAGAYLSETLITVLEYLECYRAQGVQLLDKYEDCDHRSVTVTFKLAVEQMVKRSPYGEAAIDLVRLCAFLAPDAIPEVIFSAYPFRQGNAALPEVEYFDISAAVCSYSLIKRDPALKTLSIHRLVQEVIRVSLSAEEQRIWRERTVHAVADATPDFEFADWPLCDLLLPHWRLCAEYIEANRIKTAKAAYLLYQAGRYLRIRALYTEAATLFQSAVEIAEEVHGPKHRVTADYLDALACQYRDLDLCKEAEPLHERAVKILEEVEGPEHSATAGMLHNLALLYTEQKEFARAEACFLRVLAIRRNQEGEELLTAAALTQLAGVYRYQGSYEEAEPYYRQALALYENAPNASPVDVAIACNNLAYLCTNWEQYEEAETHFLRALHLHEKVRGDEHPETATMFWGLAIVRWKQGRTKEADEFFQRVLRIYGKHYGDSHSKLIKLKNHYAEFQREAGKYQFQDFSPRTQ